MHVYKCLPDKPDHNLTFHLTRPTLNPKPSRDTGHEKMKNRLSSQFNLKIGSGIILKSVYFYFNLLRLWLKQQSTLVFVTVFFPSYIVLNSYKLLIFLVYGITLLFRAGLVEHRAAASVSGQSAEAVGPRSRVPALAFVGPATRLWDHGLRGSHRQ